MNEGLQSSVERILAEEVSAGGRGGIDTEKLEMLGRKLEAGKDGGV